MADLDYFSDNKLINKDWSKLKPQTYKSSFPVTSKHKFHWNINSNFGEDRYCFDFLHAYKFDRIDNPRLYENLKYLEIVSLASLDGQVEEQNLEKLFEKLRRLNTGGYKALSYDDKLLLNLSEVYDLISQRNFALNQDNFELFIHILFRNLVYDLDIVSSYTRNKKTKLLVKNPIDSDLIFDELENFWKHVESMKDKQLTFTSFTKAWLLGIEFLYISPYDRFNLIIMTFIIKWYLFQLDFNFRNVYFNQSIWMNYKEFIKVTQDALESRDLNEYLEMMRAFSKRETIFAKHMEWIMNLADKTKRFKELKRFDNLIITAFLMRFEDRPISIKTLTKSVVNKSYKVSASQLKEKLAVLVDLEVLEEHNGIYHWIDPEFKKQALLYKE